MLFRNILIRTYLVAILVISISAIISGILVYQRIETESYEAADKFIDSQSNILTPFVRYALKSKDFSLIEQKVGQENTENLIEMTIFGPDQEIIYDTTKTNESFDNSLQRPEFKDLFHIGKTQVVRYSPVIGDKALFWGIRLTDVGKVIGYIRLSYSLKELDQRQNSARDSILASAIIAALFALIPCIFFTKKITHPFHALGSHLSNISLNGSATSIDIHKQKEFAEFTSVVDESYQKISGNLHRTTTEKDLLSGILSASRDGIIAIDSEETVIYINEEAAGILGANHSESMGKPLWEITRVQAISAAIRNILKNESAEEFEEIKIVGDAGDIYIKLYGKPIVLSQDNELGAVFILQDITTLRKLADMRKDLVTNVAHEFKTPLTAIRGIAETLLENKEIDQDRADSFLQRVIDQSDRLTDLSSDLLELSRIESKEDITFNETHDIRPIIEESFKSLKERAKRKNIRFEYDHCKDPLYVVCGKHSILQIVENLLDNAIKYTESGGNVRIAAFREGRKAIIEVQDSGFGIETIEKDRIFERFYRTTAARKPNTKGTGLGLSIVKSLVASYEGTIRVDSTPGRGSIFRVSLPYKFDFH